MIMLSCTRKCTSRNYNITDLQKRMSMSEISVMKCAILLEQVLVEHVKTDGVSKSGHLGDVISELFDGVDLFSQEGTFDEILELEKRKRNVIILFQRPSRRMRSFILAVILHVTFKQKQSGKQATSGPVRHCFKLQSRPLGRQLLQHSKMTTSRNNLLHVHEHMDTTDAPAVHLMFINTMHAAMIQRISCVRPGYRENELWLTVMSSSSLLIRKSWSRWL